MPSNCLIIFSTSASWLSTVSSAFRSARFSAKRELEPLPFAWSLFPVGRFRQSHLLLLFRFLSAGSFFSSSVLVFVRVSSSGIFFSKTTKLSSCLSTAFFASSLSSAPCPWLFLFRDWLGLGLLEGFLNGLLAIRDLLPFVLGFFNSAL